MCYSNSHLMSQHQCDTAMTEVMTRFMCFFILFYYVCCCSYSLLYPCPLGNHPVKVLSHITDQTVKMLSLFLLEQNEMRKLIHRMKHSLMETTQQDLIVQQSIQKRVTKVGLATRIYPTICHISLVQKKLNLRMNLILTLIKKQLMDQEANI